MREGEGCLAGDMRPAGTAKGRPPEGMDGAHALRRPASWRDVRLAAGDERVPLIRQGVVDQDEDLVGLRPVRDGLGLVQVRGAGGRVEPEHVAVRVFERQERDRRLLVLGRHPPLDGVAEVARGVQFVGALAGGAARDVVVRHEDDLGRVDRGVGEDGARIHADLDVDELAGEDGTLGCGFRRAYFGHVVSSIS